MTDPNEETIKQVENYLEQQSVELDQYTRVQLDDIRQQALAIAEQHRQPTQESRQRSWLTNAGYAVAFSVAVIAGALMFSVQPDPQFNQPSALELVLLNDDFELLEQDLDFYAWVELELPESG